jgi:hypothetical protein
MGAEGLPSRAASFATTVDLAGKRQEASDGFAVVSSEIEGTGNVEDAGGPGSAAANFATTAAWAARPPTACGDSANQPACQTAQDRASPLWSLAGSSTGPGAMH